MRFTWTDAARAYIQSQKASTILKLLPQSTRYSLFANRQLLSLKVADVAAGSGHILLSAARRIGLELARVRSGEDQPSPPVLRQATRDVINSCIYGVDKNPLAVELCKVALWLEAHNPGEPLNFLDHRIKCGDAIVGLAHADELQRGIPDEAFKTLADDDKVIAAEFRRRNKQERKERDQISLDFDREVNRPMNSIARLFDEFNKMPEHSPQEIEAKQQRYQELVSDKNYWRVKVLADIQAAQFFIPKTEINKDKIITDSEYYKYLSGQNPIGPAVGKAIAVAEEKRFFHWFLEFPEVFALGGFDCILGNPPFLGGQRLSGIFGHEYLQWLKTEYAPAGSVDLVTYFFRRIFTLLRQGGFQSLIATNTIAQGGAREGGLDVIRNAGGSINHAVRSMRWPGLAAVEVALVTIHNGKWNNKYILDRRQVNNITTYLDDAEVMGDPIPLEANKDKSFQGSIVLGRGFIITPEEAQNFINKNHRNKNVLFPYLNGEDLNSHPDQSPSRWVINFFDWPLKRIDKNEWNMAKTEQKNEWLKNGIAEPEYQGFVAYDYPDCIDRIEKLVKPERQRRKKDGTFVVRSPMPQKWWIYAEKRPRLYKTISLLDKVLVKTQVTKTSAFVFVNNNTVFDQRLVVFGLSNYYEFCILQSTIHTEWSWKNGSTMKTDLTYTPSTVFETFPILYKKIEFLEPIGKSYYLKRQQIMQSLKLGLTKTYSLFHCQKLVEINHSEMTNDEVSFDKETKNLVKESLFLLKHLKEIQATISFNEVVRQIKKLREMHTEMDQAVLKAYGWDRPATEEERLKIKEQRLIDPDGFYPPLYDTGIDLRHDFYEVDYLPENDRVRFTIHPEARKEVLKRLLELNHAMHEWEVRQEMWDKKTKKKEKGKEKKDTEQGELF